MQHSIAIRISLLALLASLCFSFLAFPLISESQRANIDPDRFGQLAANLAEGNGFVYEKGGTPVLERTPLYSFLVAGLFAVSNGFSLSTVQILQAIFHSITAFVVYLIGVRLYGKRTSLIAQALFALHPIALWYTARIWLETTHTMVLAIVAFAVLLLFESPSAKRASVVGAAIGLACLTKSILILFPAFLFVLLFRRFKLSGLKLGVVVLIAMLVVISPWTYRNYLVTRQFLPVNTSLGFNFILGDIVSEQWLQPKTTVISNWVKGERRVDSLLAPANVVWESLEGDRLLIRAAMESYLRNPMAFARRSLANVASLLYLSESLPKSVFFGMFQIPLALIALISYVRMTKELRRRVLPIIAIIAYYIIVNVAIVGWARYSMPMIPFLLLIVAPLFTEIITKLKRA